ncbi:ArsR/SmtB family transcription factor [Knoellia remsis]|uniref:ArsR/SmtB family transcription factor n=1 Tax=Knoellia remsis TaxID=407159 RepID=UPI000D05A962|nr:helix-turn-helix domain-containing protein [Knoellia remsis]
MERIELSPGAMARVRWGVSPLGTLSAFLRLAASGERHPVWGRARDVVGGALDRTPLVAELVPRGGRGYMPLVAPPLPAARPSADDELDVIRALADSAVDDQLSQTGRPMPRARRLLEAGQITTVLVAELSLLWRHGLARVWPDLEHALDEECQMRSHLLGTEGLAGTLDTLHPRVRWAGDGALLVDRGRRRTTNVGAAGLVVVPSLVDSVPRLALETAPACISYPVGLEIVEGSRHRERRVRAAARMIGDTRWRVLQALDEGRSTTELAERLRLPLSTVATHVSVLYRAGLLTRRRVGRSVVYERDRARPWFS